MRVKLLFVFLGVIVFFFTCCQKKSPQSLKPKSLNIAIESNFNNAFHPVEDSYIINYQPLLRSIYSTLFKLDSSLKPFPFLIKKYEKKGKTVFFYLKENSKFSDGSNITSKDVVWSIEAGLRYKLNPNPVYRLIEGGEDIYSGRTEHCSGIEILTPGSFKIDFKSENIEFPYYFTSINFSIIPEGWTRETKIFSGAFKLVEVKSNKNKTVITLKKNPFYIGKKPKLDCLFFNFYKSHPEFERVIKLGEPDIFFYNFYFNLLKSDYKYHYFKIPLTGSFLFLLNPKSGVFKDKHLRLFFKNYILSFDFIKSEKLDYASQATHVLPYGLSGYFVFKPFKKENFAKYIPQKKITVRCFYPNTGIRKRIFPYLKEKLKEYNINLELHQETWAQLNPRMRRGDFDLTAFYYMVDIPNSFYFYENLFTSNIEMNPANYQIPEALELLTAFREEVNELKRLKILSCLEEIAQDESFVIPYLNSLCLLGYKSFVKNAKVNSFLYIPFEDINIEKRN